MPNYTTHYHLAKPLVNDASDQDLWGDELNNDMDIIDEQLFIASQGVMPTGAGCDFWGTVAPDGFLFSYGQILNIVDQPALGALFGSTFGGDGITTFGMPDKRGRSSIGKDDMGGTPAGRVTAAISGVDGTILGAAGGSESLESHTHTGSASGGTLSISIACDGLSGSNPALLGSTAPGSGGSTFTSSAATGTVSGITVTNNLTGAGASQNLPPGIVCNYIVKT